MHTDSATEPASLHVQFLCLPQAMHGTLHSALDVVRTAATVLALRRPQQPCRLSWEFVTPDGEAAELAGALSAGLASAPHAVVDPERSLMVIPAVYARNAPHLAEIVAASQALPLLQRHAAAGGWLASCHNGLVFPAHLGLLDGARIAAPWPYLSWLQRTYPACRFAGAEPMAAHGRVFSTVAPALQTEFMIEVLASLLDPDLAQACANLLLHQPQRQQMVPDLAAQKWLAPTADSPVYRAMRWLQNHLGEPYRLSALAQAAAASERTLLRHFREVVGMTPLDYLHGLRVERAKVLLEVSLHDLQTIAIACGYANATSFRRLFHEVTGINPSEYRARFRLRSRRPRWKVETAERGRRKEAHAARQGAAPADRPDGD